MQNNQQKGSLADKFADFGAPPSDKLWAAVSANLDTKKKRRPLFFWWISAFCLIGFTFFIILNPVHNLTEDERKTKPEQTLVSTFTKFPQKAIENENRNVKSAYFHLTENLAGSRKQYLEREKTTANNERKANPEFGTTEISSEDSLQQKATGKEPVETLSPLQNDLSHELTIVGRDTSMHSLKDVFASSNKRKWNYPSDSKWKFQLGFNYMNSQSTYVYIDNKKPVLQSYDPEVFSVPETFHSFQGTASRKAGRWWFEAGLQGGIFRSDRPANDLPPFSPDYFTVTARTWTIGIPAAARFDAFYIFATHSQIYLRFGTVQSFPFHRTDTYNPGTKSLHTSFVEERNFFKYLGSVSATVGIEQHIWKGLSADFRPEFWYFYKPPTNTYVQPEQRAYWWFGMNFGVNWSF